MASLMHAIYKKCGKLNVNVNESQLFGYTWSQVEVNQNSPLINNEVVL